MRSIHGALRSADDRSAVTALTFLAPHRQKVASIPNHHPFVSPLPSCLNYRCLVPPAFQPIQNPLPPSYLPPYLQINVKTVCICRSRPSNRASPNRAANPISSTQTFPTNMSSTSGTNTYSLPGKGKGLFQ